jgi:predicted ATPase
MNNIIRYISIENFKSFTRIEKLDFTHPSVIIGPNNSGKTTVLQALALWNHGIKSWYHEKSEITIKKNAGIGINRLLITQVPVKEVKYFWNNIKTKQGKNNIEIKISVGLLFQEKEEVCTLIMKYYNSEVVYLYPDEETIQKKQLLEFASQINVKILYPMSGINSMEFLLQKGAIDTFIGQGRTAEVLVNLCYNVFQNSKKDWEDVCKWMKKLFEVELQEPKFIEANGTLELKYNVPNIKGNPLDISLSGRGQQELLLLLVYLYSNKKSVLLLDEPDAHLEILRQRQVFALIKHLAYKTDNQIIIATHSEVISNEANDNLTLIVGSDIIDLTDNPKKQIKAFIDEFGIEHYYKAKFKKSILYVEGSTDIDMLLAFAKKLNHSSIAVLDSNFNYFYTTDSGVKDTELERELERINSANYKDAGAIHKKHFFIMKKAVPELKGIAIFDGDNKNRIDEIERQTDFAIVYWKKYELENYFLKSAVVFKFIEKNSQNEAILKNYKTIWDDIVLKNLFEKDDRKFQLLYLNQNAEAKQLQFETLMNNKKASGFLEDYFQTLSEKTNTATMLNKGQFYELIDFLDTQDIDKEVIQKLELIEKYLVVKS